jgi:acyl-CoA thioesterase-2
LVARDMLEILDVEMLDRDLFRGPISAIAREHPNLYGGQVAGQALRAAGLTVDSERRPHSLHGYFLRRGQAAHPVILRVWRDRDGASFSARRVVAIQEGEVIFSMIASFHVHEDSGAFEAEGPADVAAPETLETRADPFLVEIREVTRTDGPAGSERTSDRMWARVPTPMPDDPLLHACAITYISDLGSGFGQLPIEGLAVGGPSIDHAVWFHQHLRADDWVLLDLWPMKASGARGVYLGTVRGRDGSLGAMLSQEMLLRPR